MEAFVCALTNDLSTQTDGLFLYLVVECSKAFTMLT